jgi:hypothetical protein
VPRHTRPINLSLLTGSPDQDIDDLKRARANGNRDTTRPQFALSQMNLPFAGPVDQVLALFGHRSSSGSGVPGLARKLALGSGFRNPAIRRVGSASVIRGSRRMGRPKRSRSALDAAAAPGRRSTNPRPHKDL